MTTPSYAPQTAATIRRMGAAVISLADALAHAEQVQYDAPPAPLVAQNDHRHPPGGIARPTEEAATDSRRLAVRAAVVSGELAAENIAEKATVAASELSAAVERWAGVRA